VLLGVAVFLYGAFLTFKSQYAKSWIPTPAKIELIDIKTSNDSDSQTDKVTLQYSYTVGGKKYIGNKIGFGYGFSNVEDNTALYETLKTAKKIMIFVNPRNLQESVVIPGLNNIILGFFIFSIMWNSLLAVFLVPAFLKETEGENPLFVIKNEEDNN